MESSPQEDKKAESSPNQETNPQSTASQNEIIANNSQYTQASNNIQPQQKQEEPQIQTFQLGDKFHPVNPDDEEIQYIGERIRALENLENCTILKNYYLEEML